MSAKNYQSWQTLDELVTETILHSFFWDTVYVHIYSPKNGSNYNKDRYFFLFYNMQSNLITQQLTKKQRDTLNRTHEN